MTTTASKSKKKPAATPSTSVTKAPKQVPADPIADALLFERGHIQGVRAAEMERRRGSAPRSADAISRFIEIRLDPEHMARQRDAEKNPLPPAYHAGFVAGFLATLFTPAVNERRGA